MSRPLFPLIAAALVLAPNAVRADEKKAELKPFIDFATGLYLSQSDAIITGREDQNSDDEADDNIKTSDYETLGIKTHTRLGFQGSLPLDSGLTLKAKAQWDIGTQDESLELDEYHLALTGEFGVLQIGSDDSIAFELHTGPQSFTPGGAATYLDSPDIYPAARLSAPNSTYAEGDDSNTLTYISPNFAGFQAGVSYTPNDDQAGEGGRSALVEDGCEVEENTSSTGLVCEEVANLVSVAGAYKGGFGDHRIDVSAGFLAGSGASEAEVLSLGARYELASLGSLPGSLLLGAAYASKEQTKGCATECTVYTLGAAYKEQNYTAGVAALFADDENDDENFAVQLGTVYDLGRHVKAGFDLRYISDKDADAETETVDSFSLGFLLAVKY